MIGNALDLGWELWDYVHSGNIGHRDEVDAAPIRKTSEHMIHFEANTVEGRRFRVIVVELDS